MKENAMTEMYDTWEQNFQQLLNWKSTVMEISPDTVIELDVHKVGEKMFFRRFFMCTWAMYSGFSGGKSPLP
jgi:hypothetical protein